MRQRVWAGRGLGLPLSEVTGLQESPPREGLVIPSWRGEVSGSRSYSQLPSAVSGTARGSEFADPLSHAIAPSPLGLGLQARGPRLTD